MKVDRTLNFLLKVKCFGYKMIGSEFKDSLACVQINRTIKNLLIIEELTHG